MNFFALNIQQDLLLVDLLHQKNKAIKSELVLNCKHSEQGKVS